MTDQSSQPPIRTFGASRLKQPPKGALTALKRLVGIYPLTADVPVEKKDIETPILTDTNGLPPNSFMPFVPFARYDTKEKQLLCPDGRRGVFMEFLPADIEGRPDSFADEIAHKITIALQNLPAVDPPWIVQIYMNDEPIKALTHEIRSYMKSYGEDNQYRETWLKLLEEHFQITSRREGIFRDGKSELLWRTRYRRVRAVLYRAHGTPVTPEELNAQSVRLIEGLKEAGINTIRFDGEAVYKWLMPWLSGDDEAAYDFMEQVPYPKKEEKAGTLPPSFDIGEMCLRNRNVSCDSTHKTWKMGQRLNRFITLQPHRGVPSAGLWSIERGSGSAPFDRLPDGSVLVTTLCIEPQDTVEGRITTIIESSIGDGADARLTAKECNEALEWMASGHRLITWLSGIYIDANSQEELELRTNRAVAAATAADYDVIEPDSDLLILDTFVRALPMSFRPELDKASQKRARLVWDSHVARTLPLYGRGRGTGNPGTLFYNRLGEPTLFDPLNSVDRTKNAHMLVLGPTGSGKTATLVSMLMHTMAVHKPRIFLVTALPTFYLLGDYFREQGLTVNHVQFTAKNQPSLPPFADIPKLITGNVINDDELVADEERDILGEASIAARLMITGGSPQEEARLDREDHALIKEAILLAAQNVVDANRQQALTEDVVTAFRQMSQDTEKYNEGQRNKLSSRAAAMDMFTKGIEGKVFNRLGEAWPDADVTIVEMGLFARQGYEDRMAIAIAGLMNSINNIVESQQFSGRYTITCIDEAHKLVQNPLIGPYINSISAMWRTFGGWLWLSTQNLHQFPEESRQLLNQPEWWLCLNTDEDEVQQIARFKELTTEQQALLKAARKEQGKYTEGVVMSKKILTLFRNVPPALALAIAMTEAPEKAQRRRLMEKHDCTELDAARLIAEKINERRLKDEL